MIFSVAPSGWKIIYFSLLLFVQESADFVIKSLRSKQIQVLPTRTIPASMSNNLVYIWSDSKIITPENCRSVMRRRANVCGEYCQQQSLFLLHNPLTHNLASHMRSPPVLRRPISWEVEYSQLNYWLEYPPHTCGNGTEGRDKETG